MDDAKATKYTSHILLEMAKDEYTKERERANALDNKASFFITVIVAVATVFVPIIPFSKFIGVFNNEECWRKCLTSILLVGLSVAIVLLIIAFIKLFNAYKLTDYKRPSLEAITDDQFHIATEDQINKGLCDHYKTVVDDNVAVNARKCEFITDGIKLCGVGFLVLAVVAICMQVIVGG